MYTFNLLVDKEQLIRYKFRWAEADDDPQDNQLTIDEFKSFRHPEQSRNMLTKMVQDILDNLGKYIISLKLEASECLSPNHWLCANTQWLPIHICYTTKFVNLL